MTNSMGVREPRSRTVEKTVPQGDSHRNALLKVATITGDEKARISAIEEIRKLGIIDDKLQIELAEIFKQEGLRTRPSMQLLKAIAESISSQESLQEIQGMYIHHKALKIVDDRMKELSGSIRK